MKKYDLRINGKNKIDRVGAGFLSVALFCHCVNLRRKNTKRRKQAGFCTVSKNPTMQTSRKFSIIFCKSKIIIQTGYFLPVFFLYFLPVLFWSVCGSYPLPVFLNLDNLIPKTKKRIFAGLFSCLKLRFCRHCFRSFLRVFLCPFSRSILPVCLYNAIKGYFRKLQSFYGMLQHYTTRIDFQAITSAYNSIQKYKKVFTSPYRNIKSIQAYINRLERLKDHTSNKQARKAHIMPELFPGMP